MTTPDPPGLEHLPGLLMVDDDEVFCGVMSRALSRRGYRVWSARDVAGALALALERRPEYVLVDLHIGRESGLELVAGLRAELPLARIVVLTGYASIATAVEAVKLGATHYLAKPADADSVIAAFDRDDGDADLEAPAERPSVRRLEWEYLQMVLDQCGGNVSAAARQLNMHRRTLQRKLAKRPVRR
ncbi:MAG: response regulator transcription factor [Gammaproteobacteria bacterium]|nr:response regulator transcription factor [Gammaproteobacteria bacterium]